MHVSQHEKTGHAIIQNTADGENCILLFGGANKCITKAQIAGVLSHFESGDILVLQNEINHIPYLITAAKAKGMIIAFTPAPMTEDVLDYPLSQTDYILLNETEANALVAAGSKNARGKDELANLLCDRFPDTRIVLTLGGEGSLYVHANERLFQPAFSVHAVDTTAAGDTFAGFFLQSIAAGESAKKALETAAKAAAVCVTRAGAAPSIPERKELEHFFRFD